jgi:hypothetical protein
VAVKKSFTLPRTPSAARALKPGHNIKPITSEIATALLLARPMVIRQPAPVELLYSSAFQLPDSRSESSR